jgi:hypothetical protein
MKKYQDGSPRRPTMKPVKKTSAAGYFPVQNAPKVTITPKAKTGGMVNSNAKIAASKVAKGKVGGTSSAPKTAMPKAKRGGVMKGKKC